jgi:hypothetical protein
LKFYLSSFWSLVLIFLAFCTSSFYLVSIAFSYFIFCVCCRFCCSLTRQHLSLLWLIAPYQNSSPFFLFQVIPTWFCSSSYVYTAIVLSKYIRDRPRLLPAKYCSAYRAAVSSSEFMCSLACAVFHGPREVMSLHTVSQPDKEASEKISMSGFLGENFCHWFR